MTAEAQAYGEAYSGLSQVYADGRPAYPQAALALIADRVAGVLKTTASPALMLDVGAGTGIFTKQLAETFEGSSIILGIEPNADMRACAMAQSTGLPNVRFVDGNANLLPCESRTAVLVTAATAAHWFDRDRFYAEAARCLRPGAILALVQNRRRWWDSPLLEAYEGLHERLVPDYRRGRFPNCRGGYEPLDFAAELSGLWQFSHVETTGLAWMQPTDLIRFEALALSSSITKRAAATIGVAAFKSALSAMILRHSPSDGQLHIPYLTDVTLASLRS